MELVFRPEAHAELLAARTWYEKRARGLGLEFARAVEVALGQALRMPLAYPSVDGNIRHIITRKFPYSLIYMPSDTTLLVIACYHHSRKPGGWRQRITH